MGQKIAACMLAGVLAASTSAFAAPRRQASGTPAAKSSAAAHPANHAVLGVVKSVDASSLVITRSGKKGETLSFNLDPATVQAGTVAVGSTVSVRYRTDGKTLVATAVTPNAAKQEAHASHRAK